MFSSRSFNRVVIAVCFLIVVAPSRAQRQGDDRDKDDVGSFLKSVAATIYRLAWPTATYKRAEFGGFQRQTDGIAVMMKLSGEGLFGDDLWLKLGIVVNRDGIQDLRVLGHNALFAAPFETSKALGNLVAELGREYSAREAAKNAAAQNLVVQDAAGAVCLSNSTWMKLNFSYRWDRGSGRRWNSSPGTISGSRGSTILPNIALQFSRLHTMRI